MSPTCALTATGNGGGCRRLAGCIRSGDRLSDLDGEYWEDFAYFSCSISHGEYGPIALCIAERESGENLPIPRDWNRFWRVLTHFYLEKRTHQKFQ